VQIDWLTVGAQIVNFLILVFLLKRFLYAPVIDAMARREQRIADRLAEAREREATAAGKVEEYNEKVDALARERKDLLVAAQKSAEQERRERLEAARAEIENLEKRWRADLAREQEEFFIDMRQALARAAEEIARRALVDLVDERLESRLVEALIGKLADVDSEDLAALASDGEIRVVTSSDLGDREKDALATALQARLARTLPIRWETSSELVCGIRLVGGGHRLGWSLVDYFEPMEKRIREHLGGMTHSEPEA
jgi:F-type H+-transporting ATPase subunit b